MALTVKVGLLKTRLDKPRTRARFIKFTNFDDSLNLDTLFPLVFPNCQTDLKLSAQPNVFLQQSKNQGLILILDKR